MPDLPTRKKIQMKNVIILSGISGVGKSHYAEFLLNQSQGLKVSADHYFLKHGEYRFDPSKLGEAHAQCFRRFIEFCQKPDLPQIIVDNTNLTVWELAPYRLAAEAYGWQPEIITLLCKNEADVELCAQRNLHQIPLNVLRRQQENLTRRKLPSHWNHRSLWLDNDGQ
jgi:predicted kinase